MKRSFRRLDPRRRKRTARPAGITIGANLNRPHPPIATGEPPKCNIGWNHPFLPVKSNPVLGGLLGPP